MHPSRPVPETWSASLEWDMIGKRWKLSYTVRINDRAVASHWQWLECETAVDAFVARGLARAIARELQAHLW